MAVLPCRLPSVVSVVGIESRGLDIFEGSHILFHQADLLSEFMREFHVRAPIERRVKFRLGLDPCVFLAVLFFSFVKTSFLPLLGRSPPHAPTHDANGPDGGLGAALIAAEAEILPRRAAFFAVWSMVF